MSEHEELQPLIAELELKGKSWGFEVLSNKLFEAGELAYEYRVKWYNESSNNVETTKLLKARSIRLVFMPEGKEEGTIVPARLDKGKEHFLSAIANFDDASQLSHLLDMTKRLYFEARTFHVLNLMIQYIQKYKCGDFIALHHHQLYNRLVGAVAVDSLEKIHERNPMGRLNPQKVAKAINGSCLNFDNITKFSEEFFKPFGGLPCQTYMWYMLMDKLLPFNDKLSIRSLVEACLAEQDEKSTLSKQVETLRSGNTALLIQMTEHRAQASEKLKAVKAHRAALQKKHSEVLHKNKTLQAEVERLKKQVSKRKTSETKTKLANKKLVEEVERLRAELEEEQEKAGARESDIESLQGQLDDKVLLIKRFKARYRESETQNALLRDKLEGLRGQKKVEETGKQELLRKKNAEIKKLKAQLKAEREQRKEMARRLSDYEQGFMAFKSEMRELTAGRVSELKEIYAEVEQYKKQEASKDARIRELEAENAGNKEKIEAQRKMLLELDAKCQDLESLKIELNSLKFIPAEGWEEYWKTFILRRDQSQKSSTSGNSNEGLDP